MTRAKKDTVTMGVISDTHGLLRPEVAEVFRDVDRIIHAGDIGTESVLDQLRTIAPVTAVRGNMDGDNWAFRLRRTEAIEIMDKFIYVIHDISRLDLDPAAAHINVIISGHSHRPSLSNHDDILYLNPGSAGHRRFSLPISVALLHIHKKSCDAELIKLAV